MKKLLIVMIILAGATLAQGEMAVKTKLVPEKKAQKKLGPESPGH